MTQNIAVVGSGFLGMTLALRLVEQGQRVTIFEAAPEIGGLAAAWEIGNYTWDKHYHVTLASDTHTRRIVEDLGLADEFNWVETKTGFYTGGELVSMSNTLEFLAFPALDLISKLRLGATIFWASRVKNWQKLERVSVERWLTRLSGRRTFEKIWKPLLQAKLGEAYHETSAAFIWATIQRMYAARNSGLKKEMFGYIRGGYARVLGRFSEVLIDKGVEIRLDSPIAGVERLANGKFSVDAVSNRRRGDKKARIISQKPRYGVLNATATVARGFSGGFLAVPDLRADKVAPFPHVDRPSEFDKVIFTCPSGIAARCIDGISRSEKQQLTAVRYQGIVCASVLMKCSLSDFYVTNITDEAPFTGVIEMTALVNKREFGNNALVYLPKYADPSDEIFEKSDAEIRELFLSGLEKMYSKFRRKDVVDFKVSHVRQVFPLPVIDYSRQLPPTETSVKNIYIVNSSHIVNGTLNINETVALAERFAKTLEPKLA